MRLLLTVLAMVLFASPVRADEFRPAYLQLTQRDATSYDVLWKVPALDEKSPLPVYLVGGIASYWLIERVARFFA